MDMKTTFESLVKAGRMARNADFALQTLGYDNTPYADIYACINDVIYNLIGENAETFDQSETYRIMNNCNITEEQCVEKLMSAKNAKDMNVRPLSSCTMSVLIEEADKRKIHIQNLKNLIISEWAARQEFIRSFYHKVG